MMKKLNHMLEIRPTCENCNKILANESGDAMICSFECTFCEHCATNLLKNVCPNCGGGLERRPTRPSHTLAKNPPTTKITFKPVDPYQFAEKLKKFEGIDPRKR